MTPKPPLDSQRTVPTEAPQLTSPSALPRAMLGAWGTFHSCLSFQPGLEEALNNMFTGGLCSSAPAHGPDEWEKSLGIHALCFPTPH